jgi:PadR family transcriptional regulator PadR
MLRRLDSQGLLTSAWREEDKRNKRFYRLSPDGDALLRRLEQDWRNLNTSIEGILEEGPK